MKKQKIGITLRITNAQNYDEQRDSISHDWIKLSEKINIIPILIPNSLDNVREYINSFDINGIILSGGENIGETPERDKTEKQILEFAIKNSLPIFGVCRGMQIMNEYFGGKIIKNETDSHVNENHMIRLTQKINDAIDDKINVNSFHNNIITKDNLGKELESFAIHDDDTIEGFIHKKFHIMGVMWHPERKNDEYGPKLLQNFFNKKI